MYITLTLCLHIAFNLESTLQTITSSTSPTSTAVPTTTNTADDDDDDGIIIMYVSIIAIDYRSQ